MGELTVTSSCERIMAAQHARATCALVLGALAICTVLVTNDNADETELVSSGRFHTVVERSCYMRECSSKNGKEICHTSHKGCHPMKRSSFMPHYTEHVIARDVNPNDFDSVRRRHDDFNDDVWRMPLMRIRMPRFFAPWNSRAHHARRFSESLAGTNKIRVTKAHSKPPHQLTMKVNAPMGAPNQPKMAKKLTKKQLKRVKTYEKKIAAAKKQFLKKVLAARKKLPKNMIAPPHPAQRRVARTGPAGGCYERQCMANGGRMHCEALKLNCSRPNGMMPMAHMARMLRKMFHPRGRSRAQHPIVHVVRIRPMAIKKISPTMKKKLEKALKKAFSPQNLKKEKKTLKNKIGVASKKLHRIVGKVKTLVNARKKRMENKAHRVEHKMKNKIGVAEKKLGKVIGKVKEMAKTRKAKLKKMVKARKALKAKQHKGQV